MSPEPVSPELVLIDPELAERERARLREKAALEAYLTAHPPRRLLEPSIAASEPVPERPRLAAHAALRKRLLPAALIASLFANGYLASDLVLRADRQASPAVAVAVRPVAGAAPETSVAQTTSVAVAAQRTNSPHSRSGIQRTPQKALVERQLVSLVLSAPARKLPRAFVDPKTGLVRNNVQVVCRAAKRRSYLCRVRLANARAGKALVVRYRSARTGRGAFTWYGYKSSN